MANVRTRTNGGATVQDLLRALDTQHAGHVARMRAMQADMRADVARSRAFEQRIGARLPRVAAGERAFQATTVEQIVDVDVTLAAAEIRYADLRADIERDA